MTTPLMLQENEVNAVINEELQQLQGYEEIFRRTHPKPVLIMPEKTKEKDLTFIALLGYEALMFALSAAGGAILAAIRTGAIFYASELALLIGLNVDPVAANLLSWTAGGATLFAVEGFLLGFGFYKGKKSGKLNTSWWGVAIAFLISALAGIASSMPLLGTIDSTNLLAVWIVDAIKWLLVFISGVGASVLVFLGTENLGVLVNDWKQQVQQDTNSYQVKLQIAQDKYDQDLEKWNGDLQNDYRTKGRELLFNKSKFVISRDNSKTIKPKRGGDGPSIEERVVEWLTQNSLTAYDVGIGKSIEPSAVAQAIQEDAGNVRTALSRLRDKIDDEQAKASIA